MRTDEEMFKRCFVEKSWKIIRSNLCGLVLDIGCRDGLLTAHHKNSIGIDIERQQSYIPLVLADMHFLPFKKEVFDTVVLIHVLEHTDKPKELLMEIKRILRSQGKLIISIPNAKTWFSYVLVKLIGYDGYAYQKNLNKNRYWQHKLFMGYNELKKIIEKEFKIEKFMVSTPHIPLLERIFDYGFLRKVYWKLGDIDKFHAKDLIFICKKE